MQERSPTAFGQDAGGRDRFRKLFTEVMVGGGVLWAEVAVVAGTNFVIAFRQPSTRVDDYEVT
jgi:hypothetical protein